MSEKEVGWWEWGQSIKDKVVNQSAEVFEFVKKDIEEFSKVVSDEATSVVSNTATSLKETLQLDDQNSSANQVKKSVSGFFNHVAEVFTPPPDDEDQEAIMMWNQQPVTLDRLQASIYAFCSTPSNFLKEPESEELYEGWLQSFQIESHENELPNLLLENGALSSCYSALVPAQLSHTVFWHRYFYQVQRLEKAEEKRQEMKKRALEEVEKEECTTAWEDEDELGEKVEISEQMQQKLLEEYEREIQEEGTSSSSSTKTEDGFEMAGESREREGEEEEEEEEGEGEKRARESKAFTPASKDTEEEWEKIEPETSQSGQPLSKAPAASPAKRQNKQKRQNKPK